MGMSREMPRHAGLDLQDLAKTAKQCFPARASTTEEYKTFGRWCILQGRSIHGFVVVVVMYSVAGRSTGIHK